MARTINRTPYTVSEPDISYKFFNHNNWKGVCDDKNFLGVDQESFADAKNVYIDAEGVLKTRPSVVEKSFDDLTDCTVYDAQTYENTLVLKVHLMNDKYDAWYYKIYENDEYLGQILTTEKSKILLFDNKLIIFNGPSIEVKPYAYYDLVTKFYNTDASSLIYVPNIATYTLDAKVENESHNLLTNAYRETFVYSTVGISSEALGKDLYYVLDNYKQLLYNFSLSDSKYILQKKFSISVASDISNNSAIALIRNIAEHTRYDFTPVIPISIAGNSILLCNGSNKVFHNGYVQTYCTTSLSYSANGKNFKNISLPDGKVAKHGLPQLSKDGSTIFAILSSEVDNLGKTAALYALTVSPTITGAKYKVWTELRSSDIVQAGYVYALTEDDYFVTFENYINQRTHYSKNGTETSVYDISYVMPNYSVRFQFQNEYHKLIVDIKINNEHLQKQYDVSRTTVNNVDYFQMSEIALDINLIPKSNNSTDFTFNYVDTNYIAHNVIMNIPDAPTVSTVTVTDYETNAVSSIINDAANCMFDTRRIDNVTYAIAYNSNDGNNTIPINLSKLYTSIASSDNFDMDNLNLVLLLSTDEYVGGLYARNNICASVTGDDKVNLYYEYGGNSNFVLPDFISTLNQNVIAIGNKTYIDENRESDDLSKKLLYFPEALLKRYDYDVNALHPISTSQMGVFFDDSVWIIQRSENKLTDTIYPDYLYTKSQVHVGLTKGSDVVTSYDGKNVIFATQRGLVAMSYQDFIASTDQSLSYLSDSILVPFVNYCKDSAVKMFLFRYWLIVYKQNAAKIYVIDLRNGSWWPMEYKQGLVSACVNDGVPLLVSDGSLFAFNTDDESCKDWDNTLIIWKLLSQKLHFNAPNYYKHLYSLTINAVNDSQRPIAYLLGTTNYRNIANVNSDEVMNYQVDIIRSYVKRMNYSKVNEFQYELRNSKSTPSRLSISNVTLKYTITSLVR